MGRSSGARETHLRGTVPALDSHAIYQRKQDVILSVLLGRQTKPSFNLLLKPRGQWQCFLDLYGILWGQGPSRLHF